MADSSTDTKGGLVVIQGSPTALEYQKFEQFPGKFGDAPGNPYTYRPYPKMLYRAEKYPGSGQIRCMAVEPNPSEYNSADEFRRDQERARMFTQKCQLIVQNEEEEQKAKENGWRNDPHEAVKVLEARDWDRAKVEAHREYEDRNMSEAAKREVEAHREELGGAHVVEMAERPRRRGRPPGSKNKPKE